jgi:F-type H+-transporting ATPase subunit delta
VHPSLRGYAEAVAEESDAAGEAARLADDLTGVVDLLGRTPDLFAAVTDVGVPEGARRALMEDLLSSRLSAGALRIVLRAVHDERGPELPVALADLAERARLVAQLGLTEVETDEPILGRMANRALAAGYAVAVLEMVDHVDDIEEIEDELFRFARIVEASVALSSALTDAGRPVDERRALVTSLLEGRALAPTGRLARAAVHPRGRDVVRELDAMVDEAARARGWRVARVRTARPIDGPERERLAQALQTVTGAPVELQETEEPDLLGGAVVEVGDLLVDASAKHRLDQLEDHLLGSEGATRGAMS